MRTLQHTATHCNTLQHTAMYCNTLQHILSFASYVYLLPIFTAALVAASKNGANLCHVGRAGCNTDFVSVDRHEIRFVGLDIDLAVEKAVNLHRHGYGLHLDAGFQHLQPMVMLREQAGAQRMQRTCSTASREKPRGTCNRFRLPSLAASHCVNFLLSSTSQKLRE